MAELNIEVHKREKVGKGSNRKARSRGQIPAVVYGSGKDSVPIQVDRKTFIDLMKKAGSETPLFLLKLTDTGQERHAMVRDMQVDPVSRQVIHIDFQRVEMTEKIRVTVPIELVGNAVGAKLGGMVDFVTRDVQVECLPGDIPKHVDLDVTNIEVGQHAEAKDLTMPNGVVLADEPEKVILSIHHARLEEATEAEAAAERAEPEVIKRGKTEEE
jgi:large subunit ribosomal protein L25